MKSKFLCVIIILSSILLSGCIQDNNSTTLPGKVISISGVSNNRIINDLNDLISLDITGINNNITVTSETNLVRITMSGTDNIVHVSRHHSFTQDVTGVGNIISFYD